jgi:hypothetical protein
MRPPSTGSFMPAGVHFPRRRKSLFQVTAATKRNRRLGGDRPPGIALQKPLRV